LILIFIGPSPDEGWCSNRQFAPQDFAVINLRGQLLDIVLLQDPGDFVGNHRPAILQTDSRHFSVEDKLAIRLSENILVKDKSQPSLPLDGYPYYEFVPTPQRKLVVQFYPHHNRIDTRGVHEFVSGMLQVVLELI
jgi:hypothetical protein